MDSKPNSPSMNIWSGYGAEEVQRERGARHREGDNVLFGDLHVDWVPHLEYPHTGTDYAWQ